MGDTDIEVIVPVLIQLAIYVRMKSQPLSILLLASNGITSEEIFFT